MDIRSFCAGKALSYLGSPVDAWKALKLALFGDSLQVTKDPKVNPDSPLPMSHIAGTDRLSLVSLPIDVLRNILLNFDPLTIMRLRAVNPLMRVEIDRLSQQDIEHINQKDDLFKLKISENNPTAKVPIKISLLVSQNTSGKTLDKILDVLLYETQGFSFDLIPNYILNWFFNIARHHNVTAEALNKLAEKFINLDITDSISKDKNLKSIDKKLEFLTSVLNNRNISDNTRALFTKDNLNKYHPKPRDVYGSLSVSQTALLHHKADGSVSMHLESSIRT